MNESKYFINIKDVYFFESLIHNYALNKNHINSCLKKNINHMLDVHLQGLYS